ncbi:MAG: DUF151 domain-containing protein [Tannerella sp.]|jgi:bifunctional DNase/RNase|nr:DUF151 domain-containing protein [Tannerella sp.]
MIAKKNEVKIDRYILSSINRESKDLGMKLLDEKGNRTISMKVDIHRSFPFQIVMEPFNEVLKVDFPPILLSDFLKDILEALGNEIVKIVIHDLEGEEYSAKLYLNIDDRTGYIDIHMQDALALIARTETPLFVKKKVFKLCDEKKHSRINWYDLYEPYAFDVLNQMPAESMTSYPVDELEIFLEKAVEKEEYSLAAKIRNVLAEKIQLKIKN